jgi:hypothetical protein
MENQLIHFSQNAYEYLLTNKPDSLSNEQINNFISKPDFKCTDLKSVYGAFVSTIQDYQSRPRVINYAKRKTEIDSILCNLDYKEVLNKYNPESLLSAFSSVFPIKNIESKSNTWRQFSISLIDGARFLSSFTSYEDFDGFIKMFSKNSYTKEALPLMLGKEIHGMGLALACDWLKELGYLDYPKPDLHLIDVFYRTGLADNNPWSCFKATIKAAEEGNMTPYALDKIIWLICTGNYYRYNVKAKPLKEEFILSVISNKFNG